MNLFSLILLILVIIISVVIYSSWNKNKVLLSGFKSGTETTSIAASKLPSNKSSNNYAYSIWFYVKNWQYKLQESKCLLRRGTLEGRNPEISFTPYENNINVNINMYPQSQGQEGETQTCTIRNFPLQKWCNLIVSLNGRALDMYLDGKLVRTCILPAVSKVYSDSDVLVTPEGGFSGWTSNVQYWSHPLNPQEAYNIYKGGYGSGGLGGLFEKYKIRVSYLVDNSEKGSFDIV